MGDFFKGYSVQYLLNIDINKSYGILNSSPLVLIKSIEPVFLRCFNIFMDMVLNWPTLYYMLRLSAGAEVKIPCAGSMLQNQTKGYFNL